MLEALFAAAKLGATFCPANWRGWPDAEVAEEELIDHRRTLIASYKTGGGDYPG